MNFPFVGPFYAARLTAPLPNYTLDTFDSYLDGVDPNGLNQGINWTTSYTILPIQFSYDDMESYASGVNVSGSSLNGGVGWTGVYIVT